MGRFTIDDVAVPIIGFSPIIWVILHILGALEGCQ